MSQHSQDFYQFQFDASLSRVLQLVEVDGRKTKIEKITGNTFDIDTNASGAVTQVVRTEVSRQGTTEVSIYSDANGDQRFDKTFEIEVAGASARQLEQHRFTFDNAGNVTAEMERKGNGTWKTERIDANEHFSQVQLDGVNYLLTSSPGQTPGIPSARRRSPAARMFLAALMSRSCAVPHSLQTHSLIPRPALPFGLLAGMLPQHEQVWVV